MKIVIGTRGSPLALTQTKWVRAQFLAVNDDIAPEDVTLHIIETKGDKITDRALAAVGGKGLFTEELEAGLLERSIDFAVHSLKDMPTMLPDGLALGPTPKREDPRDALITTDPDIRSITQLPKGARVGTASLRRSAQAMALRPDIEIALIRGNVQTRINKVLEGQFDATFLACAGLRRLGSDMTHVRPLSTNELLPAPGQGALAIEYNTENQALAERLMRLDDMPSAHAIAAERALLAAIDGDCRTPIAAHATLDDAGHISLRAALYTPDGVRAFRAEDRAEANDAARLGQALGDQLRSDAAGVLFS
ncbi:MAG: hydroxymethylbilane synthase [Pseudomonadota bacterium]